ncbi:hypothetical protein ABEB36_015847 [Hypothenemus hampei]|uniref:CCHC-type domain-containing protein n=1 Tax=Hypothenemus hampei TaxID=57062 RepID=A0ABD1DYS8_HYPHA
MYGDCEEDQYNKIEELKDRVKNTEEVALQCTEPEVRGRYAKCWRRSSTERIHRGGTNDYNTTLRNTKTLIEKQKLKNAIINMRSTRDSKLLIAMEKDNTELNKVYNALKGNKEFKENDIRRVGDRDFKTLIIRGMDASKRARKRPLAIKPKTSCGNRQAGTLNINKTDAELLLKIGKIEIGCNRCTIEERLHIKRCNKCWGLQTRRIRVYRENRKNNCYKCGGQGHLAKNCGESETCPLCGVQGHRAGAGACREFRRALSYHRNLSRAKDRTISQENKETDDSKTSKEQTVIKTPSRKPSQIL